jgi:toxin ParE1/3/4
LDEELFLFHPVAVAEVLNAYDWYAKIAVDLAERFQNELERSRQAIERGPTFWPEYLNGTRRYLLHGFPYFIVYRATSTRIEIIAVAHEKRQSGYWIERNRW